MDFCIFQLKSLQTIGDFCSKLLRECPPQVELLSYFREKSAEDGILFQLLYAQTFFQLQIRGHIGSIVDMINDHTRFAALWFFDMFDLCVVHRHLRGFHSTAVGGSKDGRLCQSAVRNLLPFTDNNAMGTRNILGVEPNIAALTFLESQLVILNVVASDQNSETVVGDIFLRIQLLRFHTFTVLSAEIALRFQLGADARQLIDGSSTGQRIENGINIEIFLFALFDKLQQFLIGVSALRYSA